jgi:hypothetical protein
MMGVAGLASADQAALLRNKPDMIAITDPSRLGMHQGEFVNNLGNRLRRAIEQVEDAEFRELNDQPSDENRAA